MPEGARGYTCAVDDIPALFREAQDRGLREECEAALREFSRATELALAWQRQAGRALAEERLATGVLKQGVERWVEREKGRLRNRLLRLLG